MTPQAAMENTCLTLHYGHNPWSDAAFIFLVPGSELIRLKTPNNC